EGEAASGPLRSWLASQTAEGDRWGSWVVGTDDLDGIAAERGLEVADGARRRPDGIVLRWRMAGLERALDEPPLPFFIEWLVPAEDRPGRSEVDHPAGARGIAHLEVAGDEDRLREWLGGADLPVAVVDGPPGVRA